MCSKPYVALRSRYYYLLTRFSDTQSAAEKGSKPVDKKEDEPAKTKLDEAMKAAMDAEQELKSTPAV
jgi:hypothetical protein